MKTTMKKMTIIKFTLLAVVAGVFLTVSAQAATLTVTKTADTNDTVCDADCSFREAFDVADGNGQTDTINFNIPTTDAGCGGTANCTITLTSAIEPAADGSNLTTVTGTGANTITLSGGTVTRLFNILSNVKVSMSFLTISGGNGANATNNGFGGAILVSLAGSELLLDNIILQNNSTTITAGAVRAAPNSSLTITNSIIRNNTAPNFGGGLSSNNGIVTVTNTIISGNTANAGGGVSNAGSSGIMTIANSTIAANSTVAFDPASNRGGGIVNNVGSTLTLNNSTVSGNSTTNTGAGIFTDGIITLNNSTVGGNTSAPFGGGGIRVEGGSANATLNSSTISNNPAGLNAGGGISVVSGGIATLNNTIVANSPTGGDCFNSASTINAAYSLIESGLTCVNGTNSNNLTGDPNLGSLQNNGGSTETHALLLGSIAFDAGNSALTTDQRDFIRPVDDPNTANAAGGNGSDIGSFELQTSEFQLADLSVTKTDTPDPVSAGGDITYTITVFNDGPDAAASVVLTDTVPANTTFRSLAVPMGFSCATPAVGGTGAINCIAPTLAAGQATFTLIVRVNQGTAAGTVISNTAAVVSATIDLNPMNNSATAMTTVAAEADLGVTMVVSPDPVQQRGSLTYQISLTNTGNTAASNIVLNQTDFTSSGNQPFLMVTSINAPLGFTCQANNDFTTPFNQNVRCQGAMLAAGATAQFTFVKRLQNGLPSGTLINHNVAVSTTTAESNTANNQANDSTTVIGNPPGRP